MSPRTLNALRQEVAHSLSDVGITNTFDEAKYLICAALDCDGMVFISRGDDPLSGEDAQKVLIFLQRRLQREPLSRIRGIREFWSLPFELNAHTLDPRPDSECVVESFLKNLPKSRPLILADLGTGTGCLLISTLYERPQAVGVGVDLSPQAAHMAEHNAQQNGVGDRSIFIAGDWAESLETKSFDAVISNPPYIALSEETNLEPEVHDYDPPRALYGGEEGLDPYLALAPQILRILKPGGLCALEIGHTQAVSVKEIFEAEGFKYIETTKDLGGRDRGVLFRAP